MDKVNGMMTNVQILLNLENVKFKSSVTIKQKQESLNKMINYMQDNNNLNNLGSLNNKSLIIGKSYRLNDNGSIQIPWNWFENEND